MSGLPQRPHPSTASQTEMEHQRISCLSRSVRPAHPCWPLATCAARTPLMAPRYVCGPHTLAGPKPPVRPAHPHRQKYSAAAAETGVLPAQMIPDQ